MRGYDRKNPTGYPGMDYSKRRRHSYRKNQYEGTRDAKGQEYKSMRQRIKRKPQILDCNASRTLIKTSGASKATRKGVIVDSIPTDTIRNEFFSLLQCNLYSIESCFDGKDDIFFTVGNIEGVYLHISQDNIAHLMGISGILADTSPMWKYGMEAWRTLTKVERLQQILANRDGIKKFEKKQGMVINYTKAKEKNKSLFIFDLFNTKKKQTYAKRMSQAELDELYGKHYGGGQKKQERESEKDADYVMLERKKKINGKYRYVTIMFRREGAAESQGGKYYPVSIIETQEPVLSIIKNTGTTINKTDCIRILDVIKNAMNTGLTPETVRRYERGRREQSRIQVPEQ